MKSRVTHVVTVLFAIVTFRGAEAGGPLLVENRKSVVWDLGAKIAPRPYRIDLGPAGPVSEGDAQRYVQEAFDVWSQVETASIPKFEAKPLEKDVQRAEEYLALEKDAGAGNLVLFDSDGKIIDDLNGVGN